MSRRTALHAVTPNSGTNRHHNRRHNLLHKVCIVGFCLARKLGLTPVNIIQYWNYIETSRSLIGCNGTMPRSRMDELYVLAERTGRIVHIQRSANARNPGFCVGEVVPGVAVSAIVLAHTVPHWRSLRSGCFGASSLTRSSTKANWTYIGCSIHRVPSLSKVAIR